MINEKDPEAYKALLDHAGLLDEAEQGEEGEEADGGLAEDEAGDEPVEKIDNTVAEVTSSKTTEGDTIDVKQFNDFIQVVQ